ncbi:MAG: peptidase C11 [Pseudobutyrivibrio sp.]|nr:peptidase C11 [Pseudobutyrivibrio sp.]
MANRPVSRKRHVTGSGSVNRRGSVGSGHSAHHGGGYGTHSGDSHRSYGGGGFGGGGFGGLKVIIVLIIALLGGGGALFGGLGNSDSNQTQTSPASGQTSYGDLASMLFGGGGGTNGFGGGNAQWSSKSNTGVLDTNVDPSARPKYTKLKGDGSDTTTILIYMCGTDLESRGAMASKDLQEMLNATVADNINLIVYTGGCTGWKNNTISNRTNQIYQIKNGQFNLLKDNIGDLPMTDPKTLSSFIKWGAQNYPADRYALIFWDHGGGSVTGYGYDEKHKNAGSMELGEINKALTEGGLKYDFVGFDACLMATVETGLMLDAHSDYMIASEETEPGIGWYYTNWLTNLSKNPSVSTLDIGKTIVDDFVAQCGKQCPGQKTTLSVVDLAELSATVPEDLKNFATATSGLIDKKEYKTVSNARSSTREFAQANRIDQIDLIDFAVKMDTDTSKELVKSLKGAVKYNNTSSNMINAYGLSIYFPYRQTSKVDNMVNTYGEIGMDESYSACIQKFASVEYYGQQATNNNTNPMGMLLGSSGGNNDLGSADAVAQLLNMFLSQGSSQKFLENGVDVDTAAEIIAKDNIDSDDIKWTKNDVGDDIIALDEDKWDNVQDLELTMLVKDGDGYIDLGKDNIFDFDDDGNLMQATDRSWLAIDGQIVAYYHLDTTGDENNYTITGKIPVMLNDERADLIVVFTSDNENGYIAGATYNYDSEDVEVIAKNLTELNQGDVIDFICDYYTVNGDNVEYEDTYYLGDKMAVKKPMNQIQVSNLVIEDKKLVCAYVFTDIYGNTIYSESFEQ